MTKTATAKLRKKAEQAARAKQQRALLKNHETALRENQEKARRDHLETALDKDQERALTSIDKAANKARERGILTKQAYNESIEAALNDMRKDHVPDWTDVVVVNGVAESEAVHANLNVASPITVSIAESITSAALTQNEETPASDPPSKVFLPDSDASGTVDAPQIVQDTTSEPDTSDVPELLDATGTAFLHCVGCPRVDLAEYAARVLPCFLKEDSQSPDRTSVLILCGTCQKEPRYRFVEKSTLEGQLKSSFEQLSLMLHLLEGSAGARAVRSLAGGGIEFLARRGAVDYRDVDKIIQQLSVDDRIGSIDIGRFQDGHTRNLKLGYLRGGLISSRS
ncbi:hypothetical protein LTR95_002460 [Oleoguttula sp. CCFEE 5521]